MEPKERLHPHTEYPLLPVLTKPTPAASCRPALPLAQQAQRGAGSEGTAEQGPRVRLPLQAHRTANRAARLQDSGTKAALTPAQLRLEEQTCHRTEKPCQEDKNRLPLPSARKAAAICGPGDTSPRDSASQWQDGERSQGGCSYWRQPPSTVTAGQRSPCLAVSPHRGPAHPCSPLPPPTLLLLKTGSGADGRVACMVESQPSTRAAHRPGACGTTTGSD